MVSNELIYSQDCSPILILLAFSYSLISIVNSVKKVANKLLELWEGNFAGTLRVNLFES